MGLSKLFSNLKGGPGSGHWAHDGRLGQVGGSIRHSGGFWKLGFTAEDNPSLADIKREAQIISGKKKYPLGDHDQLLDDYWMFDEGCQSKDCNALHAYTTPFYYAINGKLRGTREPNSISQELEIDKTVLEIDSALDKAPRTERNMTVYRQVSSKVTNMMKEGEAFTDNGYVSTTTLYEGENLEIRIPKGSKGAYVDAISDFQGEQEFLLPRKSQFRILSNKKGKVVAQLIT